MKKIKITFWVIVVVLLILVGFQNKEYFLESRILKIDLMIVEYETPDLASWVYFLSSFLFGAVIMYIFNFFERFKLKKSIKGLNNLIVERDKMLDGLRKEFDSLRAETIPSIEEGPGDIPEKELAENESAAGV
ncbi:MAG: hypothetical protein HKM93_07955 [Desulfobacteraceae bacterium]|nr:hypothetical protein [Desulfobacteraceae bacterium]